MPIVNPPRQAKRRREFDPKDSKSTIINLSPIIMPVPATKDLLESACHFGHKREKWNPLMNPYIFGVRRGIHIFDLEKTREHLEKMCEELKKLHNEGKSILFISTKQQSTAFIDEIGKTLNQPKVTKKWIPGLLTNWDTIKRRIKYYLDLQQSFKSGEVEKYTKQEQTKLRKELTKLDTALSGVSSMTGVPDAVFVIDAVRDHVAVLEAKKLGIPVYGICDSNANPDDFTMFVPANDDAVKSISIILTTVIDQLGGPPPKKSEEKMPKKEAKEEPKENTESASDSAKATADKEVSADKEE